MPLVYHLEKTICFGYSGKVYERFARMVLMPIVRRLVLLCLLLLFVLMPFLSASSASPRSEGDAPSLTALHDLAFPVFSGQGGTELVMVSDPFCPFCRRTMRYLMRRQGEIKRFSLVFHPLSIHPGADAACWFIAHVRDNFPDMLVPVVRFAYGGLKVPGKSDASKARQMVVAALLERFPEVSAEPVAEFTEHLRVRYAESVSRTMDAARKSGVSNIPVVLGADTVVVGYKVDDLEKVFGN